MLHQQLRDYFLYPCLNKLGLWSKSAEELLVLTYAQESKGGKYIHQVEGPALSGFQIEPTTHDDIWKSYLVNHPDLSYNILTHLEYSRIPKAEQMMNNIAYAVMMARIHYRRVEERLPDADDVDGLASYWKRYYNTEKGSGTVEQAVKSYCDYVGIKKSK